MPRTVPGEGLDKFMRYRAGRRAQGMRLLCVWMPDSRAAGFHEETRRQALLLRGAPEEAEALDFIAAAANWDEPEAEGAAT